MYCDLTDVQALNAKRQYSASSTPTSTQVGTLMAQIATEIDMAMSSRGYAVPVTSPTELVAVLSTINAYGAAALAEQSMFPETVEKGSTPHWKMLWDAYRGWLVDLKAGVIPASLAGNKVGGDTDEIDDPKFSISESVRQF
jgi:hypothetical protein